MTTIYEEQKHRNLTCVDIVKDALGANPTEINDAINQLVIHAGCKDNLSLTLIKKAITEKYTKLNTTIENFGNKQVKITSNVDYFFIDAAWGLDRIKKNINNNKVFKICATPATFTDPSTRPSAQIYFDINDSFDLQKYGLDGSLIYNSDFTTNRNSVNVKLKPIKNNDIYHEINCDVNIKGSLLGCYQPTKSIITSRPLYKSIFHGNPKKKKFINEYVNNDSPSQIKKLRNLFVMCKEIGDLMQAVCLEYLIKQPDNINNISNLNSALLTNDAVLAARSLLCKIPYIVSHISGLIKYYIPGDSSEINKYYIKNYHENFVNNNESVSYNLYLFNNSHIDQLSIKNDNTKFKSSIFLEKFVSKIKNIITITNIIFSDNFIKYIYEKTDIDEENNLKIFKIFFSSLSIPNIIYKLSDISSKTQSNRSLVNINYKKIFSKFFAKNLEDSIKLSDSYISLNNFINNYFNEISAKIIQNLQSKNLEKSIISGELTFDGYSNLNISLFFNDIILKGNIVSILNNDNIDDKLDDDKKISGNLNLYEFLKAYSKKQFTGGISKKINNNKNKNKKKTKKFKKTKKYKKTRYSKKYNKKKCKYNKKTTKSSNRGGMKRKLQDETISVIEYESFDIFCELYQYIYINPYLYYYFIKTPQNLKNFIQNIFNETYIQENIYNLITNELDEKVLDDKFQESNEIQILNNEFITNADILKPNFSNRIEYEDIDEYKAETLTTINLLNAIQNQLKAVPASKDPQVLQEAPQPTQPLQEHYSKDHEELPTADLEELEEAPQPTQPLLEHYSKDYEELPQYNEFQLSKLPNEHAFEPEI